MDRLRQIVMGAALALLVACPVWAGGKIDLNQSGGGITELGGTGNAANIYKPYTDAGEDPPNDVQKVELRFTNIPAGGSTSRVAADQLYKSSAGYVRGISCFSDAAATAGSIVLLDSTVAGAGNILWSFDVLAVAYNTPFFVPLEVPFSVGLFLDFTTTADVFCTVSYR